MLSMLEIASDLQIGIWSTKIGVLSSYDIPCPIMDCLFILFIVHDRGYPQHMTCLHSLSHSTKHGISSHRGNGKKGADALPIKIKNLELCLSLFMFGFHGIGSLVGKIKRLSGWACLSGHRSSMGLH